MTAAITSIARPRKPWIAVALAFLATGLGQVYCGRIAKGLVLFSIALVLPLAAWLLAQGNPLMASPLAALVLMVAGAVNIYAIVDSYLLARRGGTVYWLQPFNRWYVYVALVLASALPAPVVYYHEAQGIRAFRMTTDTMSPTILVGDRVMADRLTSQAAMPRRGDVVAFIPPTNRQANSIGRVVALAGDSLGISGGVVYVNNLPLKLAPVEPEDPAATVVQEGDQAFWESNAGARYRIELAGGAKGLPDFPLTTVPSGCVFILCDNRSHARDSRHYGPVSRAAAACSRNSWPAATREAAPAPQGAPIPGGMPKPARSHSRVFDLGGHAVCWGCPMIRPRDLVVAWRSGGLVEPGTRPGAVPEPRIPVFHILWITFPQALFDP